MKLINFKRKLRGHPYFTSAVLNIFPGSKKTLYNQLVKWQRDGEIIRLRRGLFTLNENDRKAPLSRRLVANVLYYPSYISLEYALSFYGMIPEAVGIVTSISNKKTQRFVNKLGEFTYKNIKKKAFFGYEAVKDEFGLDCLMATREKALLDYFYLNVPLKLAITESFFEENLRLQNVESLDLPKMIEMSKKMKSRKLLVIIKKLKKWLEVL